MNFIKGCNAARLKGPLQLTLIATATFAFLKTRKFEYVPEMVNFPTDLTEVMEKVTIRDTVESNSTLPLDLSRPAYYPWAGPNFPKECRNFSVRFLKPNTNRFKFLASFPASGNTWTRFLIEGLSGVYTGSIYTANKLSKYLLGEPENPLNGTLSYIKTHLIPSSTMSRFKKKSVNPEDIDDVILLIRNPFEALKSFFQWQKLQDHHGQLKEDKFFSREYKMFCQTHFRDWYKLIETWATVKLDNKYVIFYEDLVDNLENELVALKNHMKIKVNPIRFQCLLNYSEGHFHREKSPNKGKKYFPVPKEIFPEISKLICKANSVLKKVGLKTLPLDSYYRNLSEKFELNKSADKMLKNLCRN